MFEEVELASDGIFANLAPKFKAAMDEMTSYFEAFKRGFNFDSIQEKAVDVFTNIRSRVEGVFSQMNFSGLSEPIRNLSESAGTLANSALRGVLNMIDLINDASIRLWGNPLITYVNNLLPQVIKTASTLCKSLAEQFDNISDVASSMYDSVKPILDTLSNIISDIESDIAAWLPDLREDIDKVSKTLTSAKNEFVKIWDQYVSPILNNLSKKVQELWDRYIRPHLKGALDLLHTVVDYLNTAWNNVLKPVVSWVSKYVFSALSIAIDYVWNKWVRPFVEFIRDIFYYIRENFYCLLTFFS